MANILRRVRRRPMVSSRVDGVVLGEAIQKEGANAGTEKCSRTMCSLNDWGF